MRTRLTLACALGLLCAQAQTTHQLTMADDAFEPAFLTIQLGDHVHIVWKVDANERTFTQVAQRPLFTGRTLELGDLPPGLYLAEVWYMNGPLLGRKRLLVER